MGSVVKSTTAIYTCGVRKITHRLHVATYMPTDPAGELAPLAGKLLELSAAVATTPIFMEQALPAVRQVTAAEFVAIVRGEKGRWRTLGVAGAERALPAELLAEVLDEERPASRPPWHVVPLEPRAAGGELLAIYRP